jgi:RND superfamily putative drug exporter
MTFSTASVARMCSRHPGRTLAAWGAAVSGAIAALLLVLTGFTTEAAATNNPQSERANDRLIAAFRPDPEHALTDLVVVRSARLTVDGEQFRTFADGLVRTGRESGAVLNAVTYFDTADPSLVSSDRHSTLIPINIANDDAAGEVIDAVQRADADPNYAVTVTGSTTRDHDFNELSKRDLQNGELKFGLPAALLILLLILLLVFGTVVAGLVPLLMALVAITTALGLVALLTQLFELSIFTTNMLTGNSSGQGMRAHRR